MTPVDIAHATLPLERVGTRWRVLTPTQAVMHDENENLRRDMEVAARHTAVPPTPTGSSACAALLPGAAGPAGRDNERSGRRR